MGLDYAPIGWTGEDTDRDVPEEVRLRIAIEAALGSGAIGWSVLPYTGQPSDTETVVIGGTTFEFCTAAGAVANNAYVAVLIGANARATMVNLAAAINAADVDGLHDSLFKIGGVLPAVANSAEAVLAIHANGVDVDNGNLYILNADEAGGTPVAGSTPSLVLSDTATNVGPWKWTNLNLSTGSTPTAMINRARVAHTVVAGDLTATQPLLIPVAFAPTSVIAQVADAQGARRDAYVEATIPAAIGGQNFVAVNLADTTPTVVKRKELTIPVNAPKREVIVIPVTDNDDTLFTWFPGRAVSIVALSFARSEAAGSTLTVSADKITASTAAVVAALATDVDVATGTDGAVQTFTPDEAGGALPIALTKLQGLAITVSAGNGTVAPLALTLIIDYTEAAAIGAVHWNPPVAVLITAYKFIRPAVAGGTLTMSLDKITKATGAVATALASLVDISAGTEDVEQTFTADDSAPPTAVTTAQGLKASVVAGVGNICPQVTLVVEYIETVIATDVLHLDIAG